MLVNNSATTATKGIMTGTAHSLSNLFRMLGVLIVGKLFDIGLRNRFPFLPFMVASLVAVGMLAATALLPFSLNRPKVEAVKFDVSGVDVDIEFV